MKKILKLFLVVGLILLASCKEKKESTIIITEKPKPAAPSAPKKMGDYKQTRRVEWRGGVYTIETQLMAVDSLPLAKDGNQKYYDNKINLRIVRADGSVFFQRDFTKSYFKSYVDDIYYKDGALLGIVFVKAEEDALCFAASVGSPDKSSDEYVPLVLRINNLGAISVSKDTQLDTGGEEEE